MNTKLTMLQTFPSSIFSGRRPQVLNPEMALLKFSLTKSHAQQSEKEHFLRFEL